MISGKPPAQYLGFHANASKVINWSGMDSEERFHSNCKNPTTLQQLQAIGFDTPDCITYSYNRFGFRDQEFDDRPSGLAIGCSFTEGVGIPQHATWPAQLSKLLGVHVWNLGVGGGCLDTAYNMLEYYIDKLNVKYVILCTPPKRRFEFYRTLMNGSAFPQRVWGYSVENIPEIYSPFIKEWFATDENFEINYQKNLLAMKQICHQHNVPFVVGTSDTDFKSDCKARDLSHPGVAANLDFANKMHVLLSSHS